jgi:hypothetical protein
MQIGQWEKGAQIGQGLRPHTDRGKQRAGRNLLLLLISARISRVLDVSTSQKKGIRSHQMGLLENPRYVTAHSNRQVRGAMWATNGLSGWSAMHSSEPRYPADTLADPKEMF